ncbi:MAG TPA: hypothetical protein VJU83_06080 [Burkholderiales bacterium]|nr:hypothetical protein [Burkholderiales bacterium]
MVTPLDTAIRHVRICAEIERFDDAKKSVIARLLADDNASLTQILDELTKLRALTDMASGPIGARIARVEEYLNASRNMKATMLARLAPKKADSNVVNLKTMKFVPLVQPAAPLLWGKKAKTARSKKVVQLFSAV